MSIEISLRTIVEARLRNGYGACPSPRAATQEVAATQVVDCAVLVAIGLTATGHRQGLGVSVALPPPGSYNREFGVASTLAGKVFLPFISGNLPDIT